MEVNFSPAKVVATDASAMSIVTVWVPSVPVIVTAASASVITAAPVNSKLTLLVLEL